MSRAGGSLAVMWQRLGGWPAPVQWAALAALSALIWLIWSAAGLPAGLLMGAMIGGIVFGVNGIRLEVPRGPIWERRRS